MWPITPKWTSCFQKLKLKFDSHGKPNYTFKMMPYLWKSKWLKFLFIFLIFSSTSLIWKWWSPTTGLFWCDGSQTFDYGFLVIIVNLVKTPKNSRQFLNILRIIDQSADLEGKTSRHKCVYPRLEKMQNFPGIWSQIALKMWIFYKFSEIFRRKRSKYPSKR